MSQSAYYAICGEIWRLACLSISVALSHRLEYSVHPPAPLLCKIFCQLHIVFNQLVSLIPESTVSLLLQLWSPKACNKVWPVAFIVSVSLLLCCFVSFTYMLFLVYFGGLSGRVISFHWPPHLLYHPFIAFQSHGVAAVQPQCCRSASVTARCRPQIYLFLAVMSLISPESGQ